MTRALHDPLLLLLLLVPLLALWMERSHAGRWRVSLPTLAGIGGTGRTFRVFARRCLPAVRAAGIAALVVACARPVGDRTQAPLEGEGIDIALVVDVSGSMKAEDLAPGRTRLQVVKEVLKRFVEKRRGDRMGIISFARYPNTVCPFTIDATTVAAFVDRLEPVGLQAEDGTAIGVALAQAARRLKKSTARSRVVVLLTDGANNVDDITPEEATRLAAGLGIRVYTIMAGRDRAAPAGAAFARADSKTLIDIARATGGRFFKAEDAESLDEIYDEIGRLEKSRIDQRKFEAFTDLFRPWALGGLLLLLASTFADHTFLRRLP